MPFPPKPNPTPEQILDASTDAIISRSMDGTVLSWNKGAENLYGWDAKHAIGKNIHKLLKTEFREPLAAIEAKLEKYGSWTGELVQTCRDGHTLTVLCRKILGRDEAGNVFVVDSNTDITAREYAEEKLRESERRFRSYVQATAQVIWRTNERGEVDTSLEEWCAFTGQSEGEARGFGWMNAIHTDDRANVVSAWKIASDAKAIYEVEYRLRTQSNEWRDILARGVPILNAAGNVMEYIGTCIDFTDRKHAEQAERRAEELYRQQFTELEAIYNTAPLGLCVLDTELRYRRVNPFLAQINGKSVAEHLGKTVREVVPSVSEQAEEALREVLQTGKHLQFEFRCELPTKPGVQGIWDEQWYPLRESTGKIIGVGVVVEDVTERRKLQYALTESEERFRTLGDNIAQLAWMTNPDGWIFWYNKRWYEYTGSEPEEMRGWGWQKVHHPDHVDRVTASYKEAMESGRPWEDTFPLRGKDGRYRWFLSRAFPIRDSSGNIVRWFGTNTDITELREAQAKLAERESILRTVTSEARVGLVMVNRERRYLFANQPYADILGLPDADIVGKRVADVLPQLFSQIEPKLDQAFKGQRVSYELHMPHHRKFGADRIYEVVYEPRLTSSAEAYVVVVIVDITERKQMQQTLERTVAERTAELKDTNEQLEALVYSIAHDLRSPLRATQGYSELLMETAVDGDKRMLERIHESARYMDRMIVDLLQFGRAARAEIELAPVRLKDVWQSALYQVAPEIEKTHATIEATDGSAQVLAYEPMLVQILSNLLTNAMKFVAPGITPHVRFWTEEKDSSVRLWLADNGIGIEPIYHDRIFRVFERLQSTEYAGTGIGLAIVRKGIERMNGKVGLESEPGKGTRFWIELPKAR